ncbi:unnamed protein product [[Actinomadura] parvosata subsp. kistnae]|nr:unnamed protein product [Actinomadura parvosata subsp. kistnae]
MQHEVAIHVDELPCRGEPLRGRQHVVLLRAAWAGGIKIPRSLWLHGHSVPSLWSGCPGTRKARLRYACSGVSAASGGR